MGDKQTTAQPPALFSICVPQLSFSVASASSHSSLRPVHKAAAASSSPPSRARQPFCPAASSHPLRSLPPPSCRPPLVCRPPPRFHRSRPLHHRCPPPSSHPRRPRSPHCHHSQARLRLVASALLPLPTSSWHHPFL